MEEISAYHQRIREYYRQTHNAYKDSWELDKALSIHYGYSDDRTKHFADSLIRMNEEMASFAGIHREAKVLDAGCGVGGSSIYLAAKLNCHCTGITISEIQKEQATANAVTRKVNGLCVFELQDYCNTNYPDESFDVVWALESSCYAISKEAFVKEAYRLLRPGGKLIIADGMATSKENNQHPVMRKWLEGWAVNYLETPEGFNHIFSEQGFHDIRYRDITPNVLASSVRLRNFSVAARLYGVWLTLLGKNKWTDIQYGNIRAAWHQYYAIRKGLWKYGMIVGIK